MSSCDIAKASSCTCNGIIDDPNVVSQINNYIQTTDVSQMCILTCNTTGLFPPINVSTKTSIVTAVCESDNNLGYIVYLSVPNTIYGIITGSIYVDKSVLKPVILQQSIPSPLVYNNPSQSAVQNNKLLATSLPENNIKINNIQDSDKLYPRQNIIMNVTVDENEGFSLFMFPGLNNEFWKNIPFSYNNGILQTTVNGNIYGIVSFKLYQYNYGNSNIYQTMFYDPISNLIPYGNTNTLTSRQENNSIIYRLSGATGYENIISIALMNLDINEYNNLSIYNKTHDYIEFTLNNLNKFNKNLTYNISFLYNDNMNQQSVVTLPNLQFKINI